MPGDEQGHQLVAQLLRGHRRFVLVARIDQHAEDVVALGLLPPPLVDQLEQERVSLLLQTQERGEWTVALEHPRDAPGGRRQQADRTVPEGEHGGQTPPERVEPLARIEAEDRPQDDLQRQPLQARAELDRLSARPARNLAPATPPRSGR